MRLISSLLNIPLRRWAKLLAGLAFIGLGIAFTKEANLGLGPWDVLSDGLARLAGIRLGAGSRDGLMLGLSRKTGWSLHLTRTALEVTVLAAGWFLGGAVGVGTVLVALTVGPVIQFMSRLTGEELGGASRTSVGVRGCCGC